MPKLHADTAACQGYGNCVTRAPDAFDIDDDGVVVVLTDTVTEDQRARIEVAVRSCPVSALRMEND
jgi:ferredoxin